MKVVLGLGNPGMTYHRTRHNVGFMIIQALAKRRAVSLDQRLVSKQDHRPASVCGDYLLGEETVRLVMPLTMMNESGDALRDLDIEWKDLMIVCDDVSIPLGALRMRPQGSAGGHNGLQSCLTQAQTEQISRLRVGVGSPAMPADLKDYVLSAFGAEERPVIEKIIEQAADACETWVKDGIDATMNRYNTTVQA